MQPLSLSTRRSYFYSLLITFCVAVPLLILYALGYRLDDKLLLVPTGGLYIATDMSGAEISLNDEPVRETGAFRRAFFIQDLEPGAFKVRVSKADYHSWEKLLPVDAHVVTEAAAFLLPLEPELREIEPSRPVVRVVAGRTATSTVANEEYAALATLFDLRATSTATTVRILGPMPAPVRATTSPSALFALEEATTTVTREGIALRESPRGVSAYWFRSSDETPYFFCTLHESCTDTIDIDVKGQAVTHFDFLPGRNDVVLVAREDAIVATEIDPRGGQNTQPLYEVANADFRIGPRGEIYIKDGNQFFEVTI